MKKAVYMFFAVYLMFNMAGEINAGTEDLAGHFLLKAGINGGICSLSECRDINLAVELAKSSDFIIHVQAQDFSDARIKQEAVDKEGLLGNRIIVEEKTSSVMPYADNLVDLVLITGLTEYLLKSISIKEIMRVLRPKGKAIIGRLKESGGALSADALKSWIDKDVKDAVVSQDEYGLWAVITKPVPAGIDCWSHWAHGPDNNPVSTDTVIKWPFMIQWMDGPVYNAMPIVTTIAGGRMFVAVGHIAHHEREIPTLLTLTARNAYNGTVIWKRKLPSGYLVHRSAFIATEDIFYMIDGSRCLMLDPQTGKDVGEIEVPGIDGDLRWIALKDGVLYVMGGGKENEANIRRVGRDWGGWSWGDLCSGYYQQPHIPWGFGTTIAAYDLGKKKTLWTHRESNPFDSRALGICAGKLFFYAPDLCLGALDVKSGRLLWKNEDKKALSLIEESGKGLRSTPGFRTTCMMLCTPEVLLLESQTRANIVAVSAENGRLLWDYKKTRNDPNAIFVDGKFIVAGIEGNGATYIMDPLTGEIEKNLKFRKYNCTRLTGCPDSFFCRGEGLGIYNRPLGKYILDGAQRPGCNDGALPVNGLLYVGPWQCDCNLSFIGTIVLCPAGDFKFDVAASEKERLQLSKSKADPGTVKMFETDEKDWCTYRANYQRSAGTKANISLEEVDKLWEFKLSNSKIVPAPVSAAAGMIFLCGSDGKITCVDAGTGKLRWSFVTAGPIMIPPSISGGRAFVGSGDGYVYALEALTGRMLWRFRAAPAERRTMIYGSLCSTWPVNSGILVDNNTVYAAAGMVDRDGTYVYALDAVTGKIKWQNNKSGHYNKSARKGVSVMGPLAVARGYLWMPGGNQLNPASYSMNDGQLNSKRTVRGRPKENRGCNMGVFDDRFVIYGGRLLYDYQGKAVSNSSFCYVEIGEGGTVGNEYSLFTACVPPAWNDEFFVSLTDRYRGLKCWNSKDISEILPARQGKKNREDVIADKAKWEFSQYEIVSVVVAGNAVICACQKSGNKWVVVAFDKKTGRSVWEKPLSSEPVANGLTIDRDGRVIVAMEKGMVVCYGTKK